MGTTFLGVRYPESTSHTRLWEHIKAVADDATTLVAARGHFKGSAALAGTFTVPAAMADVTGVTLNIGTTYANATWLAWWTADFQLITAGNYTGVCQLVVDGVAASEQALWNPGNVTAGARATVGQSAAGTLGGVGTHTWKLQAGAAAGATGSGRLNGLHTKLTVLVLQTGNLL